jgi:uncharacterized protein
VIPRDPTVLTVPGYTGSGPGHWQTLWERANPKFGRVEQANWEAPDLNGWVETLHRCIERQRAPVILVAHSCGAATVVHWAARHGPGPVAGALLVAPADADAPGALPAVRAFAPLPTTPLGFPTLLVASDDDPHLDLERARALARVWGSRLEVIRGGGHLNTAAGYGPWPEGERLLDEFRRQVQQSRDREDPPLLRSGS